MEVKSEHDETESVLLLWLLQALPPECEPHRLSAFFVQLAPHKTVLRHIVLLSNDKENIDHANEREEATSPPCPPVNPRRAPTPYK